METTQHTANPDLHLGCTVLLIEDIKFRNMHGLKRGTRRFSNHESRLLLRSHTCAIIVILDLTPYLLRWEKGDLWPQGCWSHMCDSTQGSLCISPMKIHQSMCIQWPFCKNLNQRSLTPRWPLTPHLLRSHVWLYPMIIVSKSHGNTSMYVDTVINFANYHIHTTYYILRTTYRMSDHIVSFWTQFRLDKN